jgi:hypothetical protein
MYNGCTAPALQQIRLGTIIQRLWPGTPDIVVELLSPLNFWELRVLWDSSAGFQIDARPDLSGIPVLG